MASFIAGYQTSSSTSATNYTSIGAQNLTWNATEANVSLAIAVTTTLSNLWVTINTAPGTGKSYAFAVMKNGSATGLTVTIQDTNTTATDAVNTASFTAGDTISLRSIPTSTPTASVRIQWNLLSSSASQPLLTDTQFSATSAQTVTAPIIGMGGSLTESRAVIVMPCAGSLSNLYAQLSTAPTAGNSRVFTLRVNSSNTTLTTTISDAATTNNDTTHSVSVVAGDLVGVQSVPTGSPTTASARFSLQFTPTNSGDSILAFGGDDDPSNSATQYNFPAGSNASWGTTEANFQLVIGAWTLKNLYARTNTATGAAKSYTITVDKNAVASALTVTCTNTTTAQSITTDLAVVQGDLLSLASIPAGTPTVSRINTGILVRATSTPPPATITYIPYRPPFLS